MNQQGTINPYRSNTNILKEFFLKPIILLIAIFQTLSVFFLFMFTVFPTYNYYKPSIAVNILGIFLAVAYFILYFKSKSKKPFKIKTPLNIIKAVSIIQIVIITFLILAALVYCGFLALQDRSLNSRSALSIAVLLGALLAASPNFILHFINSIATIIYTNSVKKSSSSIYLSKKGSVFLEIISIIAAVITLLQSFTTSPAISELMWINIFIPGGNKGNIFYLAGILCTAVTYILIAVMAFSYNLYINKKTKSINTNTENREEIVLIEKADTAPEISIDSPAKNENSASFEPKPVFMQQPQEVPSTQPTPASITKDVFQNNTTPVYGAESDLISQNPYINQKRNINMLICPECSTICDANSVFCGNCGIKLK